MVTWQEIVTANRQGVQRQREGDYQGALAAFQAAVAGFRLLRTPGDEEETCAFADLLTNIVGAAERMGEFEVARDAYEEAISALNAPSEAKTSRQGFLLVECWCGVASLARTMEKREILLTALQTATDLLAEGWAADDEPRKGMWRSRIAMIHGNLAVEDLRLDDACAAYDEAFRHVRPFIYLGDSFRCEMGHVTYNRGIAEALARRWRDAERSLRQALRLFKPLAKEEPHVYGTRVLDVCAHLAYTLENRGRSSLLLQALNMARDIQNDLGLYAPEQGETDAATSVATLDYVEGMIWEKAGNLGQAETWFRSGLAWLAPHHGLNGAVHLLGASCCERLAYLAAERRRGNEAVYWGGQAIQWLQGEEGQDVSENPDAGRIFVMIGAAFMSVSAWERALTALNRGVVTLRGLRHTTAFDGDLIAGLVNRSRAGLQLGYVDQAVQDAEVAIRLWNVTPNLPTLLHASAWIAHADALQARGELAQAEADALTGLRLLQSAAWLDPYENLRSFLDGGRSILETRLLTFV